MTTFPLTPEGNGDVVEFEYRPGVRGQATCEQRSSAVGANGIPLSVNLYSAVPPVTVTPSGIVQARESVESFPGTTGSGVREALTNLKTDVPEEQSRTVLTVGTVTLVSTATKAPRNLIIL